MPDKNFFDQFDSSGSGANFFDRFEPPDNSFVGDVAREAGAGAASGVSATYRGTGEVFRSLADPIAHGLNSLLGTDFFSAQNPLAASADSMDRTSKYLEASQSPAFREAKQGSSPRGNLIEAFRTGDFSGVDLGSNPSLKGYFAQGINLAGQYLPQLLASVVTRGASAEGQVAAGAVAGGTQGAGAAYDGARDAINGMSVDELKAQSGRFTDLLAQGMSVDAARSRVADEAGRWAAALTLPVSAAGGGFEGALLGKTGQSVLAKISTSRAGRAAVGAAGNALEEGVQELGEGITQDIGQNIGAKGDFKGKMSVGQDSFANLVLGALGGAQMGGIRGAFTASDVDLGHDRPLAEILDDLDKTPTTEVLALPHPDMAIPNGPVLVDVNADNTVKVRNATYAEVGASPELQAQRDTINATGVTPNVEALQQAAETHAANLMRLPGPQSPSSELVVGSDGVARQATREEAQRMQETRAQAEAMGTARVERVPESAVPEAGWSPEFARGKALNDETRPFDVAREEFQKSSTAMKYMPTWARPKGMTADAAPETIIEKNPGTRITRLAKVLQIATKGYEPTVVAAAVRDRLVALNSVVQMTPQAVLQAASQKKLDLGSIARGLGVTDVKGQDRLATAVVHRARDLYENFYQTATAEAHKRLVAGAALFHGESVPPMVMKQYPDIQKRLTRQQALEAEGQTDEGLPQHGDEGTVGDTKAAGAAVPKAGAAAVTESQGATAEAAQGQGEGKVATPAVAAAKPSEEGKSVSAPAATEATADSTPPPERRGVLGRSRKQIDAMSPAEKDVEIAALRQRESDLLKNPITELPGRRAFEERVQNDDSIRSFGAADMDGLKYINDTFGHEHGDRLLKAIGELFKSSGLEVYHIGGDEFAITYHGTRTALYESLQQVSDEGQLISLEFTGKDGKTYLKNGLDFSFATGDDYASADERVTTVKRSKSERGLRAERGAKPVGLVEQAADGNGEGEGAPAGVAGKARRARGEVDFKAPATASVTWEVMPGQSSAFYERVKNLGAKAKRDLTAKLAEVIRGVDGEDRVLKLLGLNEKLAYDVEFGSGAYDKTVSPNVITGIHTTDNSVASLYGAALSYVFKQDAMAWHRPDPNGFAPGVEVTFSRDLNPDELQELENHLEAEVPGAGFTAIGGKLVRAINYDSSITEEAYATRVLKALNTLKIDASYEAKGFHADGDYIERGENDEGYLSRIRQADRPHLQEQLDGLRQAVEAVLRREVGEPVVKRSLDGAERQGGVGRVEAVEGKDYSNVASEAEKAYVASMERGLARDYGEKRSLHAVRPSPSGTRGAEIMAANKLASLFGKRVYWFVDRTGDGGIGMSGQRNAARPEVVAVNIESPDPLVAVFGHELFHDMMEAMSYAERTGFLRDAVPLLLSKYTQQTVIMGRVYGTNIEPTLQRMSEGRPTSRSEVENLTEIAEEMFAEMMGSLVNDPEFWADIAGRQPSLFSKIIATITKFLERALAVLNANIPAEGREYWQHTRNMAETFRDSLTEIAGDYAKNKAPYLQQAARLTEQQAQQRAAENLPDENAPETKYRRARTEDGVPEREYRGGRLNSMGGNIRDGVGFVERGIQALKDAGKDRLALGLQFLGRRQLADIYGDLLPPIRSYSDEVAKMDAKKSTTAHEAQAVVDRWKRLGPDADKLAELMHDSTLAQLDADPKGAASNMGKMNREKKRELNDRFNGLSAEAQSIYRDARDMYAKQWSAIKDALVERIMRAIVSERDRNRVVDEIKAKFEQSMTGVYFPLARFGDYFVTVKRAGDEQNEEVAFAESMGEARALQAELQNKYTEDGGYVVSPIQKREAYDASKQGANKEFVGKLFEIIGDKADAMGTETSNALIDSVNQLYLTSLPDLSWAKHSIHRKGVKGYSNDARRAFAQNMFHGGYHLARLNHADILQDQLQAMREHIGQHRNSAAFDTPTAVTVLNEMVARHNETLTPDNNPISNALTAAGFVWHMGLSPASAIVNLSQTPLVAFPIAAARYGIGKSTAALMIASKEAMAGANRMADMLRGDDKRAYDRAVDEGVVDVTMAHDLAGVAQGRETILRQKWAPVMKAASFLFHETELFNRQVTFMAGFRLARNEGASEEAAYQAGVKLVYDSHFDYSASNRARVMTGPVARVVLLFKQFSQNMIYTLGRSAYQSIKALNPEDRAEARKQLAGLLTMHALGAGALGLPWIVSGALLSVASMLGSDADEPWDAEVALRNYLSDAVGKDMAEVIMHGVPRALVPADISGRVGLDQMIFRDGNPSLSGGAWYEDMAANLLGPVAGIGLNVTKGWADIAGGNVAQGIEEMLPVSISAPLKAMRYHNEGVVDKTGVTVLEDTTYGDEFSQLLGFTPDRVKEAYAGRAAVMHTDKAIMKRREDLLRKFSMGVLQGDEDKYSSALDAIGAFNEVNPTVAIKGSTLRSSIKTRLTRATESDVGVYLPKERRGLAELGRFANID